MDNIRQAAQDELNSLEAKLEQINARKEEVKAFLRVYDGLSKKPMVQEQKVDGRRKDRTSPITKNILDTVESILSDGSAKHTVTLFKELEKRKIPFGNWDEPIRNLTSLLSRNGHRFNNDRALGWSLVAKDGSDLA